MSLHISRAQIKNFRNFADMDVVLPTSVLLGENKAGKSNLLFALRLVLDNTLPDSSRISSVITSKAANDYHFKTGQRDWPSRTENVLSCRLLWWQVGFGA
ncbi:MAG: AAA family ATPase, partial [Terriglobales bacterium]